MSGRYDKVSGAYSKVKKRYDKVNGAWAPAKARWDKSGGVWSKSYSGAVEWTYSISISGDLGSTDYGNSDTYTAHNHISAYSSGVVRWSICAITYTFSQPLLIRTGSTLTIRTYAYGRHGKSELDINGTKVYSKDLGTGDVTESYTFPSDTTINTITAQAIAGADTSDGTQCFVYVTVNSDNGSFLLNNSGTSDNQ